MAVARKKADWARTAAFLTNRSYAIKFDLEDTDYKRLETIGSGAYGVVCSALNKKTKKKVAIKKIPSLFNNHITAMRTFREIKILKHFHHDNVIAIIDILKPMESMDTFKDIYVVLDLMESDLHRIIHSNQDLTDEHIRYFLYQLLRGLKYIHSANVVHRDLKPSNLLVNEDCQLKIGDFGMARGMSNIGEEKDQFMTQYVATRWYRAPEIMLSMSTYTSAVDMWSVGCILAEMLGRKHLFPGTDSLNQLKLIIGVLGSPTDEFLDLMKLDLIKKIIKDWGHKDPLPFSTLFRGANRKARDLLSKLLVLHPKDRLTAEEALNHPYMSKYHDPEDEPICIPAFNFDFEKQGDLKDEKLRRAIAAEIRDYHESPVTTPTFSAVLKPVPIGQKADEVKVTEGQATGLQAFLNQINQKEKSPQINENQKDSNQFFPSNSSHIVNDKDCVFKMPNQSTGNSLSKIDEHSIQTISLPSSRDVEMLSARSTDSKTTETSLISSSQILPQETLTDIQNGCKENMSEKPENKTISADTKATLKAALLNASKKRAESGNSDRNEQNKKVTAMSRQKERMMKRKERTERAKRKEKLKEKNVQQSIELSAADKELLLRWKGMQEKQTPCNNNNNNPQTSNTTTTMQSTLDVNDRALKTLQTVKAMSNVEENSKTSNSQQQQHVCPKLSNANSQSFLQGTSNTASTNMFSTDQAFCRVEGNAGNPPELRKNNFPTDSLSSFQFQHNQCNSINQSVGNPTSNFGQFAEISQTLNQPSAERQGHSPMLKRKSTGSVILREENVTWRETPDRKSYNVHRSSDPVLSGFGSQPQGSPQTSQSESESTPSQGLSPLTYFDEGLFNTTTSSPEPDYMFQTSPIQTPFQMSNKDIPSCDVTMFGSEVRQPSNPQGQQDSTTTCTASNRGPVPSTLSPPRLKINASQQDVNDQEMLSATTTVTRTNLSVQTSLPNDSVSTTHIISLLSQQLSKSYVEDIYPPALVGTPKGTGGGYGVGIQLDMEMQEGSVSLESPLSATLLSDWMEVSGNITGAELEAYIREVESTSPMAVSLYADLNLTSS